MENTVSELTFEEEKNFVLPKGATIIHQTERVSVRKIKNGFILKKNIEIKWKAKDLDDSQWEYITHEWYSVDNPATITIPKEKSLADKLS